MDWSKNVRTSVWRESVRNQWYGHVPAAKQATDEQVIYIISLLKRAGRPPLTIADMEGLSLARASNMISELKAFLAP